MSEDVEASPYAPKGGSQQAHAILGASSSDRWMNCVGSVALSEGQPNNSSRYAMEGTAAHHLAETCLTLDVHPSHFIGQFISYLGDIVEDLDDEYEEDRNNPFFPIEEDDMAKAVGVYIEAIQAKKAELEALYPGQVIEFLEKSFNLSKLYPDMFGTNDYCLLVPGVILVVFDYKHGRGKTVEIAWNPQLLYYAIGAILENCQTTDSYPIEVECIIVQPRKAHKDGPVRGHTYTMPEVNGFIEKLVEAAKATALVPRKKMTDEKWLDYLKPGSWCVFCRAKAKPCPAMFEEAQELALVSFSDLSEDEVLNAGETAKDLAERTFASNELLARALKFAPVIDAWLRELSARAQHEAENGRPVEGYKLVRKRANRKITDEKDAIRILKEKKGATDDQIFKRKIKTPAQLEKLFGKTVVAEFSHKPDGTLTLVGRDDPREEVVVNPFADLSLDEMGGNGVIDAEFTVVEDAGEFDFLALPAPEELDWDII